jgi:hypothetical protein
MLPQGVEVGEVLATRPATRVVRRVPRLRLVLAQQGSSGNPPKAMPARVKIKGLECMLRLLLLLGARGGDYGRVSQIRGVMLVMGVAAAEDPPETRSSSFPPQTHLRIPPSL